MALELDECIILQIDITIFYICTNRTMFDTISAIVGVLVEHLCHAT